MYSDPPDGERLNAELRTMNSDPRDGEKLNAELRTMHSDPPDGERLNAELRTMYSDPPDGEKLNAEGKKEKEMRLSLISFLFLDRSMADAAAQKTVVKSKGRCSAVALLEARQLTCLSERRGVDKK
ncbi:hypothetical protein STEG23_004630, partial [Scotinomys teguina]